ncbi:hypothetical protein [Tritonibacter mobilis]|uniref:hypothetical protein n=1 Tax=Tritonibacter mobilis TaxID=379347 RepID=UPI000806E610|nr:hypothetical protein [Tritonibacter mobilis]
MIRNFQDDSLPQTRRSIIFFTLMSLAVYYFKPQPSLEKLGLFSDYAQDTISPQSLGGLVVIALLYLTYRLIDLIPVYQHNADKSFDVFFEKLEVRDHSIKEKINEKIDSLKSFDVEAIEEAIGKLEEKRRDTFEGIRIFSDTLTSAANEFEANIHSIRQELRDLGEDLDKQTGQPGRSSLDSWSSVLERKLGIRERIERPFIDAEREIRLLEQKFIDIGPISLTYEPSEVHEKLDRLLRAMDVEYDDFIDTSKTARDAANREAKIFGVWVPSVISGTGLSFGISTICQTEGFLVPALGACLFIIFTCYFIYKYGYQRD